MRAPTACLATMTLLLAGLLAHPPLDAESAESTGDTRQIAITFDDAPRAAGRLMSAERRTTMLLDALAQTNTSAMFFVTTQNIEHRGKEGVERLGRYVRAGHALANHSHTHPSANRLEPDDFLADVAKAQAILDDIDGTTRFFRFPFLHEGNDTAKRDLIREGMAALSLKAGYVTVDNYDWYLQALLDEAVEQQREIDLAAWREVYLEVLLAAIEHYDEIAVSTLGRSPAHVLLLHENDLAALFVDDLIAELQSRAWQIVDTETAYRDPISQIEPDTLFLGQGRVAALAEIDGTERRELVHHYESESMLRTLAQSRGLIDDQGETSDAE